MLDHNDVVGPTTRFSLGFPVVILATQITKDVLVSLAYYHRKTHGTIPLGTQTSRQGGQPMLSIPEPKDPGLRGDKYWTSGADEMAHDDNKVGELC
jgi:hypothetical protein